jgi:hypothetical protein
LTRPQISPGLLAELLDAAPARIRRRLDAEPVLADSWDWTISADGASIAAGTETITLSPGVLSSADQIGCTCLLSPRCVHLLAVLSLLDPPELNPPELNPSEDETATAWSRPSLGVAGVELTARQREAVGIIWDAGARLLAAGAQAAGSLLRADLLRAAHLAREVSLPRLAAAATRVATGMRDLAADRPSFTLEDFAADLAELLATAHRLGGGPTPADVGTARRAYEPIGAVRMHGLCSEAIVAISGYAGVVTYLSDDQGRLWTVSDVTPGGQERVAGAYRGAVRLGRLALGHHDLGRAGVFAQGVTASAGGRLGGGEGANAARLPGVRWDDAPLAGLWETSAGEQLDRVWSAAALPFTERPAGSDLLFLDAVVLGLAPDGLVLGTDDGGLLRAVAPADAYAPNLRRLAELAGERTRLIGRVHPTRPATVSLLAVASDALRLPESRLGRINLGLDEIPGAAVRDPQPAPGSQQALAHVPGAVRPFDDPLSGLRRILHRVAIGGQVTVGAAAASGLRTESVRLRHAHLPTAALVLDHLHEAASELERTPTGESRPASPEATALAWITAMTYLNAAHQSLLRAAWDG